MAARLLYNSRVMILGGAGLAGYSIARRLALLPIRPAQIILASRTRDEALQAVEKLRNEQDERSVYIPQLSKQPKLHFIPEWGDVYLRHSLAHIPRSQLEQDPKYRAYLLKDIYGELQDAYEQSHLVHLLRKRRPNIVVDAINTATGLSYQNVFQAASKVQQALDDDAGQLAETAESLLLTQSVPNLVRHVTILAKAAKEIATLDEYLKIGTTGTGGMGLNLPYTHSESQPSHLILAKNEAAFGHTGLLFLWSRTPGAPSVREIKPAAGIGYRQIDVHKVKDRYGNSFLRQPRLQLVKEEEQTINVREPLDNYPPLIPMQTVTVDCGENGLFSADEFRALSAPGSMELISPEEVAEVAVQELMGIPTGRNVLAAVAGSVLPSGYRAGTMRPATDQYLDSLLEATKESDKGGGSSIPSSATSTVPSIATGRLGPSLTKYLFEAHLLKTRYGNAQGLIELANCDPNELSKDLCQQVRDSIQQSTPLQPASGKVTVESVTRLAPTVGVPILLDDYGLVRGPNITDPEPNGRETTFPVGFKELDTFAKRGWVDLRPNNIHVWKERARHILSEPSVTAADTSSLTGLHYSAEGTAIQPAALASWILSGELHGHRDWDTVTELTESEVEHWLHA